MHTITIAPGSRVLLGTPLVVPEEPWPAPRIRLQLRTDTDCGVILDFGDIDSLRFLVSALRTLLADYRATQRLGRRLSRPSPRPRALGF